MFSTLIVNSLPMILRFESTINFSRNLLPIRHLNNHSIFIESSITPTKMIHNPHTSPYSLEFPHIIHHEIHHLYQSTLIMSQTN